MHSSSSSMVSYLLPEQQLLTVPDVFLPIEKPILCFDHRYRKRWACHYCIGALEIVSCGMEGARAWAPTEGKMSWHFALTFCLCQSLERCPGGCCCQQWKGQGVQGGGCSWWLPPSQSSCPSFPVPLKSPVLELPFQKPTQPINPILWQQPSGPHHQARHVQLGLSC